MLLSTIPSDSFDILPDNLWGGLDLEGDPDSPDTFFTWI
jgi:hypothetical protein